MADVSVNDGRGRPMKIYSDLIGIGPSERWGA